MTNESAYQQHITTTIPPMDAAGVSRWHFDAGFRAGSDRERELLAALQEAQHYLRFHEAPDAPHMQRIAAAIAKAEGSAS